MPVLVKLQCVGCAFIKAGRISLCVYVSMSISIYDCKVFLSWVLVLEGHFENELDWRCK